VIEAFARLPKLASHVHFPLQSGSDRILKLMHRPYKVEKFISICDRMREARPDIAISTDIIVGFPGETRRTTSRPRKSCAASSSTTPLSSVIPRVATPRRRIFPINCPTGSRRSATRISSSWWNRFPCRSSWRWSAKTWRSFATDRASGMRSASPAGRARTKSSFLKARSATSAKCSTFTSAKAPVTPFTEIPFSPLIDSWKRFTASVTRTSSSNRRPFCSAWSSWPSTFAAWFKKEIVLAFLPKIPRHREIGIGLLLLGAIWSYWLVCYMDLGEFYAVGNFVKLFIPISFVLVAYYAPEFLAVRAAGVVMMLMAGPVLQAAYLEEPFTRFAPLHHRLRLDHCGDVLGGHAVLDAGLDHLDRGQGPPAALDLRVWNRGGLRSAHDPLRRHLARVST